MIASESARALFVHVQKTGGLTVEQMLREGLPDAAPVRGLGGGRHARLGAALKAHPQYGDYFIFGFVRNPWARMYSWYSMVQRRRDTAVSGNEWVAGQLERNHFWATVIDEIPDFETFVMQGPDKIKRLRIPQIRFLRAGGRQADLIGRTETLEDDLRAVFRRLELPTPASAPHNNAGPPDDYRRHYNPQMRDRVAELFGEDVVEFGYEF